MALVVVALVGWVVWSPPDFVRSLYADDSPADVHGDPVPAISDPPAARLAVIGDSGTGGRGQEQIADQLAAQHGDMSFNGLVILGDMIYPDGDVGLVDDRILQPYEPLLGDGVELVPVLGNHDYGSDEEDEVLDALGRDDSWYVEQVGPVRIITNEYGSQIYSFDVAQPVRKAGTDGTAQLADLKLANNVELLYNAPGKIAMVPFKGHMSNLQNVRDALRAWAMTRGYETIDRPYEVWKNGIDAGFAVGQEGEYDVVWAIK